MEHQRKKGEETSAASAIENKCWRRTAAAKLKSQRRAKAVKRGKGVAKMAA